MSQQDLDVAFSLVASHPELATFAGRRPEELICRAEAALGFAFPPTYRTFLRELGAGSFGGFEVFGVTGEDFSSDAIPNGIWFNLAKRPKIGLPASVLIISDLGMGSTYYCLDLEGSPCESPVSVVTYMGQGTFDSEMVAPDFGAFFLQMVQEELESAGL